MTQTIAPAPAGGVPAPAAVAAAPAGETQAHRRRGRLRAAVSHTPGRMRVAAVIAVLAALAVGALGLRAGQAQAGALAGAEAGAVAGAEAGSDAALDLLDTVVGSTPPEPGIPTSAHVAPERDR